MEVAYHKGGILNDALLVNSLGEAGEGGARSEYQIRKLTKNVDDDAADVELCAIKFQTGNPAEEINGISNEALLAIVQDRLEGFQSGKFACEENAEALRNVVAALEVLKRRTARRIERGVEGTNNV